VGIALGPSGVTGGDLFRKKSPPPTSRSSGDFHRLSPSGEHLCRGAKITLRNGARMIEKTWPADD
jgi:hypothetical protein